MKTAAHCLAALTGATFFAFAGPVFAQDGSWRALAEMPTPRRLLAAAVVDDRFIYTFGGCGSPCFEPPVHPSTLEETLVEVYDVETNGWSKKKPIPAILFGAAAAPVDNKIYLVGGFVTGSGTYAYDPEKDTWSRKAPMPTARHGLAAVTLNGNIYVLGGSTGAAASNAVEIYDPVANWWRKGPPLPTARAFLAAAVVAGKIYAIGGALDCCGKTATNVVEVYEPEAKQWRSVAPLPVALQVSAAVEANGKIYVFGGFIPGSGAQSSTYEYDPAMNEWRFVTSMPEPRDQAPAVLVRGKAHVLGGSVNCHCQALGAHASYTPPTTNPGPSADLRIEKRIRAGEVLPGDSLRYTIVATNVGPDPVSGALVTDSVPRELTVTSWRCTSPPARCSADPVVPGAPVVGRVDLDRGESANYILEGVLDPEARGTLRNTATIEIPTGVEDHNPDNNSDTVAVPIGQPGEEDCVEIEKTDGRDSVAPGAEVLYRILVRNDCSSPVQATVTDALEAAGLENPRWCHGAGCDPTIQGNLRDEIELPANGLAIYRVAGVVPCECGFDSVTNTVCFELADGTGLCASDINRIVPEPSADLALDLTGPESVEAGAEAVYKITVTHQGLCPARGVEIEGQFPEGFAVLAVSSPCEQGFPCEPGDIAPGDQVEITATLKASEFFVPPAFATVSASVESDCDPVTENDADSVRIVAPLPSPAVQVVCDGITGAIVEGGTITYTFVLSNSGPGDQADAVFADTLPSEVTLEGATADSGEIATGANTVTWHGPIPAGGQVIIRITATIGLGTTGVPICDPAILAFDADGDGVNESAVESGSCCFRIIPIEQVPLLTAPGAAALILLLAFLALTQLRRIS